MPEQSVHPAPVPPFVLVDEGGWLALYTGLAELHAEIESGFADAEVFACDGAARPLAVTEQDGALHLRVAGAPDLAGLRAQVERFFERWVRGLAPEPADSPAQYLARLAAALDTLHALDYPEPRYRRRTALRRRLPHLLLDLGLAAKGSEDCGRHEWYHHRDGLAHCYHCAPALGPWPPTDA
ncbi:hypothetical protein [Kitasatospora sp. NPDC088134]|uniref:hypothetical protein n=1 Tax=Kitasatospora sp. NPDC088134 TaxID=3364071 RepID=UPI00382DFCEE